MVNLKKLNIVNLKKQPFANLKKKDLYPNKKVTIKNRHGSSKTGVIDFIHDNKIIVKFSNRKKVAYCIGDIETKAVEFI